MCDRVLSVWVLLRIVYEVGFPKVLGAYHPLSWYYLLFLFLEGV